MIVNNILITEITNSDFTILEEFLNSYEYTCVQLSSYLRKKDKNLYLIKTDDSPSSKDNILGFFYLNKVFIHCIPFLDETNLPIFETTFINFISNKIIKTIIGTKKQTDLILFILNKLNHIPKTTINYKLMILNQFPNNPPENLSNGDEIKRCTEYDFEFLFDLQKKYLIKEVAPATKQVSNLECSVTLKEILKNQLVFAIISDGEFVSKANTNAIGFNWIQLGGIYTHPLFRNNYYAWHLIYTICIRILKTNRSICLFVKEKNFPAFNLYKNIGFIEKTYLEIAYF